MIIKKNCALGCAGLLFTCVALMTLCIVSVWPKTRTPPVDMYDLMLDVAPFPQGWILCGSAAPLPKPEHGERASVFEWFCPEGFDGVGGASHEVYRYRNELDAAILFHLEFSGRGFPKWHMIRPWAVPEEWSYVSAVADRFKFACGEADLPHSRWTCKAVAQYSEYISVLVTHLSPDDMTLEDVERILVAIDERMASYLQENTE